MRRFPETGLIACLRPKQGDDRCNGGPGLFQERERSLWPWRRRHDIVPFCRCAARQPAFIGYGGPGRRGRVRDYLAGYHVASCTCCLAQEIGRASCRERVCQYVYISVFAVSLKKKK